MTTRDLNVYAYHPNPKLVWAPIVVIVAMAIFGFVRGLMGAAELDNGFGRNGPAQVTGKDPRPVVLETIPSLTPRLIGDAPPAPKAPVAVNTVVTVADTATNTAADAPATAPPPAVKLDAAPSEAPPAAAPTPAAPPQPPAALQGLY